MLLALDAGNTNITIGAFDGTRFTPERRRSLLERLDACGARMVCFHGVTGYRAFLRYALDAPKELTPLGLQDRKLGNARIFLAPNPSPANAHFRPEDQVRFYDELSDLLR